MLTRDNEQILLNEIHSLCMEAADHYQAAQLKPCVADLATAFSDAAREHQEFAALLAGYIRQLDDQPKLPDPDKETLDLFLTSLRSRLAASEKQTFLDDQAKIEERLGNAIQAALGSGLSSDIKQTLERLQNKVQAMQVLLTNQA